MIIIYHQKNRVSRIFDYKSKKEVLFLESDITVVMMKTAAEYPQRLLIWCHVDCQSELNTTLFPELFHHKKMLLSYNRERNYFSSAIGYVEDSPFINVNKNVSYPTWQVSSLVGGIHAALLNSLKGEIVAENNFDYFLCSLAKLGMPLGLFSYSEPKLLKNAGKITAVAKVSSFELFRFVRQHYKPVWVVLLFVNLIIYEKKLPFLPFIFCWIYRKRKWSVDWSGIEVQSSVVVVDKGTIDVIIPTIGRRDYLYDVLSDLRKQSYLPKNVIIVEQNPLPGSTSELNFITEEIWPFIIKHTFTRQAGACNARNIALQQVESEWVFLNDDDNRFNDNLIADTFDNIRKYGVSALVTSYLQSGEKLNYTAISQTTIFGSGNSFVKSKLLHNVTFDKCFEFGYGEDTDFGLQLRNIGTDVIYFPEPGILHLKAPTGGFRIKPILVWSAEEIQPKPAPTVMYGKHKHETKQQINGYKIILFIKLFKNKGWKNPIQFFAAFQKQWNASVYWANHLNKYKDDNS